MTRRFPVAHVLCVLPGAQTCDARFHTSADVSRFVGPFPVTAQAGNVQVERLPRCVPQETRNMGNYRQQIGSDSGSSADLATTGPSHFNSATTASACAAATRSPSTPQDITNPERHRTPAHRPRTQTRPPGSTAAVGPEADRSRSVFRPAADARNHPPRTGSSVTTSNQPRTHPTIQPKCPHAQAHSPIDWSPVGRTPRVPVGTFIRVQRPLLGNPGYPAAQTISFVDRSVCGSITVRWVLVSVWLSGQVGCPCLNSWFEGWSSAQAARTVHPCSTRGESRVLAHRRAPRGMWAADRWGPWRRVHCRQPCPRD
jgi:hypothetical protein